MKKIVALVAAIGVLFTLTACSSSDGPEDTVKKGLDALKSMDQATVKEIFSEDMLNTSSSNSSDSFSSEDGQKLIFGNLTYKISKTDENGDEATVTTEITNKDFKTAMTDYLKESIALAFENALKAENERLSDEEIQKKSESILLDKLKAANQTTTNTVDIKLKKDDDGKWVIQSDEKLNDALTGGMVSAANDLSSSLS